MHMPVWKQWVVVGWSFALLSYAISATISLYLLLRFLILKRLVRSRGIPGLAIVEDIEIIRSLPWTVWEGKLQVVPDDRSMSSFKRRARWSEKDAPSLAQTLGQF
jgi:hypothetical protein